MLRAKLKAKAATSQQDEVESVLARLVDQGLLSDQRYAEALMRTLVRSGKGPIRIQQKLQEAGVSPAVYDVVFEELGCDWYQVACDLRRKRFGSSQPDNISDRQKQQRFLQYRGFDYGHIQHAMQDNQVEET